jgi:hypothetical protein
MAVDAPTVVSATAWPVAVTFLFLLFRVPLVRLMDSITLKKIKITVFGVAVELSPEQAENALGDLIKDILASIDGLTQEEVDLFKNIIAAGGRRTVQDMLPGFAHVDGNDELQELRILRDRHLIRPFEGDMWDGSKHPVATTFGEAVFRLTPQIPASLKTPILAKR